jgi:hypothetical protein
MFDNLALEAGKLKQTTERLRAAIDEDPLDRFKISSLLAELFLAYERLKGAVLLAWDTYMRNLPKQDLMATYTRVWGEVLGREPLDADLGARIFKVTDARYYINNPQQYDDRTMRKVLRNLIKSSDILLGNMDREIFQPQSEPPARQEATGRTPPPASGR